MEKTNPKFYIEIVPWPGKYKGIVLAEMRKEGKLLAESFVRKISIDEVENAMGDNIPPYIEQAFGKQKPVKNYTNFRLDFQGFTLGKNLKNCKKGLAPENQFARYEIQENGKSGKTAIAQVFIPTGETIDGQIVLDAFIQSMLGKDGKPLGAVIRKV